MRDYMMSTWQLCTQPTVQVHSVAGCLAWVKVRVLGRLKKVAQNNPTSCHSKQPMIPFMQGMNRQSQGSNAEPVDH